jgi:RHS repeat-associated protein
MIKWHNEPYERYMHWDEENRLKVVYDAKAYLSSYLYDAAGERTLKLQGANQVMLINGQQQFNFFDLNNFTLYTSPYMVMTPKSYTKHYYIEDERVISKIGGGMAHNIVSIDALVSGFDIDNINSYKGKIENNTNMMYRDFETLHVNAEVDIHPDIHFWLHEAQDLDKHEKFIYFYHKDHLGSSTQITDLNADVIHHIEYMPYGENFFEKRSHWATRYKFNAKEKDEETGLYYYGARYYTPEISVWLSVDPMSDKYPGTSPFMYCAGNPVILVDPDGQDWFETTNEDGSKSVKWNKSSDASFRDKSGNWVNIGTNYTQNIGDGVSINYTQNEATSLTENVLTIDDWLSQRKHDGSGNKDGVEGNCFVQAGKMVEASGAESLGGTANNIENISEGVDYLNSQVNKGNSVRIHVDKNGDEIGDHWVSLSSRKTNLKTQTTKSFGFFDPGTYRPLAGTSTINSLSLKSGKLRGRTAYNPKFIYVVTDVRKNK